MKSNIKLIVFYVVIIAAILFAVTGIMNMIGEESATYKDIVSYFKNEQVEEFIIDSKNNLSILLKDGRVVDYKLSSISLSFFYDGLRETIEQQAEDGIISNYDFEPAADISFLVSFLPYLIVIILFIVFWFYFINQATGGKGGKMNAFGRARTKLGAEEKKKVFFKDVAGCDEEKEELEEIVEFLKDPSRFTKLGARIPHGVLLVGPPGTGKTLLAKAVAGEAGVPFYSISGSDFVEMYVGVGASRVRDLFETAKKNPASIVFIDEIDAVGRHRGAGLGGGHDEREQTLNQLLVEMDGFGNNEGVIVIAATNRPDILDPALLRPGRFDRQITVGYPDIKGREDILKVHAKGKPFEEGVDLSSIAKTTVGFTGADLANLLNEAALLAARKGKVLIGMNDIEEASIKIMVGTAKKSRKRNERETKLTAYHEAGHAIAAFFCKELDPVKQISIIPTMRTGGYTLYSPVEDKHYSSRNEMKEDIVSSLGGRVAEELVMGDISTGASGDISHATSIARSMVTRYGMSDKLGTVVYGAGHSDSEVFLGRDYGNTRNYSEKTAADIDDEIRSIIASAYEEAKKILSEHMDKLHFIAQYPIDHEVMDDKQFEKAMTDDNPSVEELEAMVAEKKRKSEEENRLREERLAEEKAKREEEEHKRAKADAYNAFTGLDEYAMKEKQEQTPPADNDKTDDDSDDSDKQ